MRLLLIEDEPFIALDLQLMARAEGHEVIGVAPDRDTALRLVTTHGADAVLVDINLRDGRTGVDICREMVSAHGVKAMFVTGNAEQAPPDLAGAIGLVEKPYTADLIGAALSMLECACLGDPSPAPCPGIRLPS